MVDKSKFEAQKMDGMDLSIYGKTVQVTDAMKAHAVEKISKLERLNGHILDVHVYLDIQKIEHHVSIVAHFSHFKVKVEAATTDMYASIDKAVEKLQRVMSKWKGKIQDHHKKPLHIVDMAVNVFEAFDDGIEEINKQIEKASQRDIEVPKVIAHEKKPLKTLTHSEAMMKLELSGDVFLVYKNEEDQKLKVIYRRGDGHYGVIHAQA